MSKNISQIRYNNENSGEEGTFNLGATFDNVYLSNNNGYTLAKLYAYLKGYFDEGIFTMYSQKEPEYTNVKIWYDTTQTIFTE